MPPLCGDTFAADGNDTDGHVDTGERLSGLCSLIEGGNEEEASLLLPALMEDMGREERARAYYLLGNAYRRRGDWQGAINSYTEASLLDAHSPAASAKAMLLDILAFRDKDLFNQ